MYSVQIGPSAGLHEGAGILSGTATDTVTVNGVSETFSWDLSNLNHQFGSSVLLNRVTQFGIDPSVNSDQAQQDQLGYTTDGRWVVGSSAMYSNLNAFNLGLNFDQVWSRNLQSGDSSDAYFYTGPTYSGVTPGADAYAYFRGTPTFVSINSVAAIPEPQTYAMLMAGLGLIGFTVYRRKGQTA